MRHPDPAHARQRHGETPCAAHRVHRVAVPLGPLRNFGHSSPLRHVGFGFWTPRLPTVAGVSDSGSGVPALPLADALTRVLTVPLREVYAVLWRCGVIDIDD
ncbi:Rv1535 domain-containing protein [Mycobacterium sp. AMU20-3851]|uniref:Rv1535 domain-containing protein n=1 Tax=Mycobacterium sp. AMU20-3851 TaxID=3122055 RepID=UPI003CD0DF56